MTCRENEIVSFWRRFDFFDCKYSWPSIFNGLLSLRDQNFRPLLGLVSIFLSLIFYGCHPFYCPWVIKTTKNEGLLHFLRRRRYPEQATNISLNFTFRTFRLQEPLRCWLCVAGAVRSKPRSNQIILLATALFRSTETHDKTDPDQWFPTGVSRNIEISCISC